MTREEAIANLDMISVAFVDPITKEQRTLINDTFDMAISALSAEGEYIKKSELLQHVMTEELSDFKDCDAIHAEEIDELTTYSFPDSAKTDAAKPEEGAELIDRRQIKWYGCDHEGHIKGIDCDTADCSKCFFATVEHDEVMSLPVYRIPDSADDNTMEWIAEENEEMEVTGYFCSKCDLPSPSGEKTDFCPNCGRKAVKI